MDKKDVIARSGAAKQSDCKAVILRATPEGSYRFFALLRMTFDQIASLPASFLAASARNVTIINKEELAVCLT